MIDTDDIDKLLMQGDGDDEPSWLKDEGRSGLEPGTGLEIEFDDVPESDLIDDGETPAWLRAGRQQVDDDLEPEEDVFSDGKTASWVEIDAEYGAGDEDEDDDGFEEPDADEEEAPAVPKKRTVVHESRKTRRILIGVAAAAACIAVVSTYMFTNGIGPFAPDSPAETPAPEQPAPDGEVEVVGWTTAGEGYEDLYALILVQTRGSTGTSEDSGAGRGDMMNIDDYDVFSGTGGQIEGLLEPDIIKTDGEYIYAINSNNLSVVKAEGGSMELASGIAQPAEDEMQVYFEMFVQGDRLMAIRHGLNRSALQQTPGMEGIEVSTDSIWYPFGGQIIDTSIDIFDISDRGSPVKLYTVSQSGAYVNSRMDGDHIYLVTTYYGDVPKMKVTDPRTFVPLFSQGGEQLMPDESDILIPPGSGWPCYTVISGIDAMGSGEFISFKAVYGDVGTVYMSPGSVYLARMAFEETREPAGTLPPPEGSDEPGLDYVKNTNWSETLITKMTISSGRVEPRAQAKFPGFVMDRFAMDEYKGTLRLLSTVDHNVFYGFSNTNRTYTADDWAQLPESTVEAANALITLDDRLGLIGRIDDIAPGERVYSGRFFGDAAYFKTYSKTAPLFSVDLTDPASPRVAGALKMQWIPDYLVKYSDDKLFGLGREIERETGFRHDLVLTMLDSSDPLDLLELHTYTVEEENTAAEQNPKAIIVSSDKSLVAFPAQNGYMIYEYNVTTGFTKVAEAGLGNVGLTGAEIRGLFIGEVFYVVAPNDIYAFAAGEGFSRKGELRIDEGAGPLDRWSFGGAAGITPPIGVLPDGEDLDGLG